MNIRKLRLESLEERALLAVVAGGIEQAVQAAKPTEATEWVVNTLEDPTKWNTTDDVVSLREAIGRAEIGDTIVFDDSLSGGTITLNGSQLSISNGITIDASSIDGVTVDANGKSRVFYVGGGDETYPVELVNLTITGGKVQGSNARGGGIYNSGTLTLTNCTVSGNTTTTSSSSCYSNGGGIYNSGTLTLTNSTISENTSSSYSSSRAPIYYHDYSAGGGIYNSGTLMITNSTILGNTTTSSSEDSAGGGIYNSGTLTLTNSTISGNTTTSSYHSNGGGIYNYGTLTITNSTISENATSSSPKSFSYSDYSGGGGIYNSGTLTITNSTISGNTSSVTTTTSSSSYGGGIYNRSDGTLTLTNSTVSGNTAENGGGICNGSYSRGTATLMNSTVSGNTAVSGGGISNGENSTLTVMNSTISKNIAKKLSQGSGGTGGGIYNDEVGTINLYNSIVAQNEAENDGNDLSSIGSGSNNAFNTLSSYTAWTTSENCLVYDPSNPLFFDAENGDFTLTFGSQAINMGNNDYVTAETDFAENPRIIDGIVDLGAYEYIEVPSTVVTTLEDIVDNQDALISLREAIDYAQEGDVITFDASLSGGTIILNRNELEVTKGITIDANGLGGITIDANTESRVFFISGGTEDTPVKLIGLTITGGWTVDDGGGIYIDDGTLELADSTVTENAADGEYSSGGGIYKNKGVLTVTNTNVTGNNANNEGGGIYNNSGTLKVTNSTIVENYAEEIGGGICDRSETLTVTDSFIARNFTYGNGGGIYVHSASLSLTNSIVSGNTSSYGGGIYSYSGALTITNSTIAGNIADRFSGRWGGIHSNGTLTLTNSIVSLNFARYDNDISNRSTLSCRNSVIGLDPGFVVAPVFENGVLVNANELDLSLSAQSIAIDAGDNTAVDTETDLAGNPRIFSAWREIPSVDIGAYEYQESVLRGDVETPSTVVTTPFDVLDETDGLISLREAILYAVAGEMVTFDVSLTNRTIVLDGIELTINKNLIIDASAINGITIDGDSRSGIFYIDGTSDDISVELISLKIQNGRAHDGGGVYNTGATLSLVNMTITENSAFYGGGIFNDSGALTISNSTIVRNSAYNNFNSNYGTALYTSGGKITFYNSIIISNVFVRGSRTYAYNTLSDSYTDWTRSESCPTYDRSKPLFADPNHGNYKLVENSQAIDVGNNDYVTTETDVEGNPRILNGVVDLGAYEYQPEPTPTFECTIDSYAGTYDAAAHTVTVNGTQDGDEIYYSTDGVNYDLVVNPAYANVGTYTTYVKVRRSGYRDFYGSAYITISPAEITDVTVEGIEAVYDSGLYSVSVNAHNGDIVLFSLDGTNYSMPSAPTFSDVGTHTTYVKVSRENYYDWTGSANVVITPAIITDVTVDGIEKVYDGSFYSVAVNTREDDIVYYSNDGVLYSVNKLSYSDAGEYTIYVKVARNGYQDWFGNGTVTISKRQIAVSGTTVPPKFFDGSTEAPVNLGTVSGLVEDDDVAIYPSAIFPSAEPGDYTVTVNYELYGESASNYIAPSSEIVSSSIFEAPSTVVTTLEDVVDTQDNLISLREAIDYAQEGDTLSFASELSGGTILLDGTQLEITKGITIDASDIGGINIDGNGGSRVFFVTGGSTDQPVVLISLVVTGGNAESGGGIYSLSEALYLTKTTVSQNVANYDGGGIYNDKGSLVLSNCLISDNSAGYDGGGFYNDRGTVTLRNVTVAGNTADHGGGIYNRNSSALVLYNTIIAENASGGTDPDIASQGRVNAYNTLSSFSDWTNADQCIVYDPSQQLFTDPQTCNYTLSIDSQAINAGNNNYVATDTDLVGNPRIVDMAVDLGAYEHQGNVPLSAPKILTGTNSLYVSYGSNRHRIAWNADKNASGYELAYSENGGESWISIETSETSAVVTGLTYGKDISYRVRALGGGLFLNSDWSPEKTFNVCPMDINGDGDISGPDRLILSKSWLAEEGDDRYQYYCDLDGDGDVANRDRLALSVNWLMESEQEGLLYPRPLAADAVFAEFESADIALDPDTF